MPITPNAPTTAITSIAATIDAQRRTRTIPGRPLTVLAASASGIALCSILVALPMRLAAVDVERAGRSSSRQSHEAAPHPLASPRLAPVVGRTSVDRVSASDTLLDVAARHQLGFERVARLNPELDPWIPKTGARVRLPTMHVLPDAPHEGLVVNLPELQLYDYGVDHDEPEVIALAIGDELDPSLVGSFRIGRKRKDPVWHVPESIRAARPELPAEVPPGPDNPLGPFWLTIGKTSYGIHGTNNRWSIGREATHGCLRLYNEVVERLYARTPEGAPIRILYQTVKLGLRDGVLYVEAHPDRYQREPERRAAALARLDALGIDDPEARTRLVEAIAAARGEPIAIAVLPDQIETDPGVTSKPSS